MYLALRYTLQVQILYLSFEEEVDDGKSSFAANSVIGDSAA